MASKVPSPFEAPEVWETLKLISNQGKVIVPGIVKVDVIPGAPEIDTSTAPGQDGVEQQILGWRPGSARVQVEVINSDEFYKLKAVLDIYRRKREDKILGLQAIHPNLNLYGLNHVYIESIEAPDYEIDIGYSVVINLKEYFPEYASLKYKTKVQTIKGTGSAGGTSGGDGQTGGQYSAKKAQKNAPSKKGKSALEKGFRDGSRLFNRLTGGN